MLPPELNPGEVLVGRGNRSWIIRTTNYITWNDRPLYKFRWVPFDPSLSDGQYWLPVRIWQKRTGS